MYSLLLSVNEETGHNIEQYLLQAHNKISRSFELVYLQPKLFAKNEEAMKNILFSVRDQNDSIVTDLFLIIRRKE